MKNYKYSKRPLAVAMAMTCRDQNPAILLFSIWDFFRHAKGKGQVVIIQTDKQLSERSGLSLDQVKRAKPLLKEWGYIKTHVEKSPKFHQGSTVTHIRIPDEVMTLMEKLVRADMQICATGNEQNCIGQFVQGCTLPLYIGEVSKGETEFFHKQEEGNDDHEQKQLAELEEFEHD